MCHQTGYLTLRLPAAEHPTPEEAQALQALREKLQAEIQVLALLYEQSWPAGINLADT